MALVKFAPKAHQLAHDCCIFALHLRFLILNPFFFLHFVVKLTSDLLIFTNNPRKFLLSVYDNSPSNLLVECVPLRGQIIQKNLFVGENWNVFGRFKWRGTLRFSLWRTVTNFGGAVFTRLRQVVKNWLFWILRVELVNMKMALFVYEFSRRHWFSLTLHLRCHVFVELPKTLNL